MKKTTIAVSLVIAALFLLSGTVQVAQFREAGTSTNFIPAETSGVYSAGNALHNVNSSMRMNVVVTFSYRNPAGLNSLLAKLQDPASPQYHKYLSQGSFISRFSPTQQEYSGYVSYFRAKGFGVTTYTDRTSLSLTGTAADFEAVFHTTISHFRTGGKSFYAPAGGLSLSYGTAGQISGVTGLSNRFEPSLQPLFKGSGSSQTLYGGDMQAAYQLNKLYQANGYPTNETIATILWSGNYSNTPVAPYTPSDVTHYFNKDIPAGEPKPQVYGYPIGGAPLPGPSSKLDTSQANFESTLDLEMAGSAAPGSTVIEVYGPQPTTTYLDQAFLSVLNPSYNTTINNALSHVVAISNSWGTGGDFSDSSWIQSEQQAAARGITVLVSSGDSGNYKSPDPSYPSTVGYNSYGSLAVGGSYTVLTGSASTDGTGTTGISTQSVWYGTPGSTNGSQGGVSSIYTEPSWQLKSAEANSVITGASGTTNVSSGRGVPDVSGDGANMETYISTSYATGYIELWGTSIASPLVAGEIATMDHSLGPPEGFMNPLIYRMAQNEFNGLYSGSRPFYFITNGHNARYAATSGYSLAVGWGSINAYNFVMDQNAIIPHTYDESFSETGLPSGTQWYVNATNATGAVFGTHGNGDLLLQLLNGTYTVTIQTPDKRYRADVSPMTLLVNGSGGSQSVSFSAITYTTTFDESGLPAGTSWHVVLTGDTNSVTGNSTSSTISTPLMNGTYGYQAVSSNTSFNSVPGSFILDGISLTVNATFSSVKYVVTFRQSGLPSGSWYVNITGYSGSGALLPVQEFNTSLFNGTYIFMTGSSNPDYRPAQNDVKFTVSGSSTIENIVFNLALYKVTFLESGLPAGTQWTVNATGRSNDSNSSTQTSITLQLMNGSYNYTLSAGAGSMVSPGGSFIVAGKAIQIQVKFAKPTYFVQFRESGLPNGTIWYVNVTGVADLSSTTNATNPEFNLSDGSYSYAVATGNKIFRPVSHSGVFVVNNSSQTVNITFIQVVYNVTIKETGLPSGTTWRVAVSGNSSYETAGSSLVIQLSNGTYSLSAGSSNSTWKPVNYTGTLVIAGSPVYRNISFVKVTYNVTFSEKGLPSGTAWSVTVGNTEYNGTGKTINVSLPNGSASYSVSGINGYTIGNETGHFTISGNGTIFNITFTKQKAQTTPANLPGNTSPMLFVALAVILAILIAAGIMAYRRKK